MLIMLFLGNIFILCVDNNKTAYYFTRYILMTFPGPSKE